MNYNANINSVQDSFHWGIRWYIAKRSVYDYNVSPCVWKVYNMRLLPVSDALTAYGDGSDGYAQSILDLFHEGKNPNGATPIYLWPIKTDGCPRQ
ncbi:MAG: hypothetical protein JXR73_04215 [Candidatus Omnitrophica bacterium]|nr:hypothetical protein [Candidatus Omnitrophota bacterium]